MNDYSKQNKLEIIQKLIYAHYQKHALFYIVFVIFTLSLILRTAFSLLVDRSARDSFVYIEFAELLSKSNWDWSVVYVKGANVHFPPLLISIMALGVDAGIGVKTTGLLFVLILGSLVPVGVFLCADHIFKKRVYAFCAGLLMAVHPYSIELSANILRDAPYHCFFIFTLLAGIYAIDSKKLHHWATCGIIAGLAALTRREGIELLVIFLAWHTVWLLKNRNDFTRNLIISSKQFGITAFCFFLITFPVWAYIKFTSQPIWDIIPGINRLWDYFL